MALRAIAVSLWGVAVAETVAKRALAALSDVTAAQQYVQGDSIPLWEGAIGPYHSPFEQYPSSALPLCKSAKSLEPETRLGSASEILAPVLLNSNVPFSYLDDVHDSKICSMKLDGASAQLLAYAVSNHYWAQYFLDDLPVYGMIGEVISTEDEVEAVESHRERPHDIAEATFLFTHRSYSIGYSRSGAIVELNVTTENPLKIEAGKSYTLTYSAVWLPSDIAPEDKWQRFSTTSSSFLESNVRWFAIFNSFFIVLFLVSLVALILLRTLRADYARYLREDDEEVGASALDKGLGDDSGWKQIHGDVFRRPAHLPMYAALLGTGQQMLLLFMLVLLAAMASSLHVGKGAVMTGIVFVYALTSFFAGFVSGRFYSSFFLPEQSPAWIRVMLLTATLFPGLLLGVALVHNIAVKMNGSSNVIPAMTLVKVTAIWALASLPLSIAGTITGRRCSSPYAGTVRVNPIPRPIPTRPWFSSSTVLALVCGFLPFGSIFIETYFVFVSFAGHRFYFLYGFGSVVLAVLVLVVSCVAVVSTYYLLNAEDHKWHWHAWVSGASTGLYVFLYAAYYFFFRTQMTGALQALLYFMYAGLGSVALSMITGAVAAASAERFVKTIFSAVKGD